MGKKLVTVVIGASVVIFLASLGYFLFGSSEEASYRTIDGSENETAESETAVDKQDESSEGAASSSNVSGTSTEQDADHQACVNEQLEKTDEESYTEGSLLVSFEEGLSFSTVHRVISSEGLSVAEGSESQFEQRGWLEVMVPVGEEVEWYCQLVARTAVRSVSFNTTFQLHE